MTNLSRNFLVFGLFFLSVCLVEEVRGAVAASHSHNHKHSPSRERETDGAYSPRDSSHFDGDEDGGGHRSAFDHEAILGSAKEAEEFDNLPPEEAKKRLRVLVEKMDLNKDDNIDKKELKLWILRSFRMLSQEESKERLQEVDENEDGRVSWKEYVEETYGLDSDHVPIPMQDLEEARVNSNSLAMPRTIFSFQHNVKMIKDDKALFYAADKNKDGYLDEKEHLAFTHPEEDPDMLPVIYQQTLDDKDTNGDGQIDFKEFIGERGKEKDQEWLQGEKDKFDHELDKDRDGVLNRQEILSWVVPSNEEIATDEVAHLFAASDDDHDDLLTLDEILEHHDVFVGSEATDYGDHLHNLDRFKDEL